MIREGYTKFADYSFDCTGVDCAIKTKARQITAELHKKYGQYPWDIKLPIRTEMLKVLPVKGVESRAAMATILSFMDFSPAVLSLMQCISKTTRAYI